MPWAVSAAAFVAALVSGLFLAGLADRGHARLLMVGGIALSAVGLLWFATATELWQFTSARLLEGLGDVKHVILMDRGEIIEQNQPEEFFQNPKSARTKLFLSQILGH